MEGKAKISVWDAIWPVATIVAAVAIAVVTLRSGAAIGGTATAGFGAASTITATVTAKVASVFVAAGFKAGTALYISTVGLATTKAVLIAGGVQVAVKEALISDLTDQIKANMVSISRAGVYAGYAWPFEQKTGRVSLQGGIKFEPGYVDGVCVNVMTTTPLKFVVERGPAWL